MGCGSGCVVKELVIQSRLGDGFWTSFIYARICEFVPAFWLSGAWGGCGEQVTAGAGDTFPCLRIESRSTSSG
jgi:hypothetical protein